jgi:hypothetical protein
MEFLAILTLQLPTRGGYDLAGQQTVLTVEPGTGTPEVLGHLWALAVEEKGSRWETASIVFFDVRPVELVPKQES